MRNHFAIFSSNNHCVGEVEYTGTFAVAAGSMKPESTVVDTGTLFVLDGSINESPLSQVLDCWL